MSKRYGEKKLITFWAIIIEGFIWALNKSGRGSYGIGRREIQIGIVGFGVNARSVETWVSPKEWGTCLTNSSSWVNEMYIWEWDFREYNDYHQAWTNNQLIARRSPSNEGPELIYGKEIVGFNLINGANDGWKWIAQVKS
jgi:hypothetical protein